MAILIWNGTEDDDTYAAPPDVGGSYDSAELRGFGGDDQLSGMLGADNFLYGGLGNDTLIGGNFDNRLYGEDGDDVLNCRYGGTAGLYGGTGNDHLVGREIGGSTLDGGAGIDTMVGGKGLDVYHVDATDDVVVETYLALPGDPPNPMDTVRATATFTLPALVEALLLEGDAAIDGTGNGMSNSVEGNDAANVLSGAGGNDTLRGNDGDDHLLGGKGHDTLDGGAGTDTAAGGTGNDLYTVNRSDDVVQESAGEGQDTLQSAVSYTLADGVHVETLRLTGSASVSLTGNGLNNFVSGNTGDNTLSGGGGIDSLSYLDAGVSVTVNLAAGTATGHGSDSLSGFQRVYGSALADTLIGSAGDDVLVGAGGIDSLVGGDGSDVYVVDTASDKISETGTNAAETDLVESSVSWTLGDKLENLELQGTAANGTGNLLANALRGNDVANGLSGSSGNDTLTGLAGNDTLTGGSGTDAMEGGAGSDRYSVDSLSDVIVETTTAGEIDTVVASVSGLTLGAFLENLELAGSARSGTGNSLANRLKGTSGDDTLDGGAGSDTLDGGDGSDVYLVGGATDVVTELFTATGTDEVRATVSYTLGNAPIEQLVLLGTANLSGTGNGANNRITGNTGNNSLSGAGGNDSLVGGDGNDTLRGGAGIDTIVGGNGADMVQLDSATSTDLVTGFVAGTDDVRISMGSATRIGDGDTLVEGATTRSSPGLFSRSAELVVFTSNIVGTVTTANAAAKIGSATSAYAVGDARLFVVDNGSGSAVFRFVAADADAAVESGELTLLATLSGTASTTTADYLFGG